MIAVGVLVLQILACIGLGGAVLRLLKIDQELSAAEGILWAFAMGLGILGWALFFLGVQGGYSSPWLLGLLTVSAILAIPILVQLAAREFAPGPAWTHSDTLLILAIFIVVLFDFFEALSPPADADTLAYHFALPKQFIEAGRIEFVPRALDGAIPLLIQSTYVPPLALGGERALTLWTMTTGWLAPALIYVLARRYLNRQWSLAVALVLLTTPAVVFSAGSGQVEFRNAIFVIIAAVSIAESVKTGRLQFALLAGLAAGFFMGAKYTGLVFVVAGGVTILAQRRWLASGALFAAGALLSGSQWYIWNFINTGDPIFPMLYGLVDYVDPSYWDASHNAGLQSMWVAEKSLSVNIFSYLVYPFAATLSDMKALESSRTGFGPAVLLILPFGLAATWRFRHRLITSKLAPMAAVVIIFYTIWFFSGSSQRVRHFLPLFPLLLLCVSVAAHKWAEESGSLKPLAAAFVVSILVQLGGFGLFSENYAYHVIANESRESFLRRNVSQFGPVPWINRNLNNSDRIFLVARQLIYHLNVPHYYGHITDDARIDIGTNGTDPGRLFRQLKRHNISHVLLTTAARFLIGRPWKRLVQGGCLEAVWKIRIDGIRSRTLRQFDPKGSEAEILKLSSTCSIG